MSALGYSGWQIRPEEQKEDPVPSASRSWNNNKEKTPTCLGNYMVALDFNNNRCGKAIHI